MYWKEHFHKILNSNIVDENLKLSSVSTYIQCSEDMTVSWKDVSLLTSQLECGKSAGPDGMRAETIKFAHNRIAILSLLFTLCLSHGLPHAMIETTIVPIVSEINIIIIITPPTPLIPRTTLGSCARHNT